MNLALSSGHVAVIDDADAAAVAPFAWHHTHGYVRGRERDSGRVVYLHRLLTNAPPGAKVDHEDHDGLNNRRTNLRVCRHRENIRNARRSRANTSGFRGVCWHARAGKWQANIRGDDGTHYLGLHVTAEDAARAYDSAARALHGEYASPNFPLDG